MELTERGQEVLSENPAAVDNVLLARYPEFLDFRMRARDRQPTHPGGDAALSGQSSEKGTPREQASQASRRPTPSSPPSCSSGFGRATRRFWSSWSCAF